MKWEITKKISDDLRLQLLANRGLKTKKQQECFFNCKVSDYESDLKLEGLDIAAKRIKEAIEKDELIAIYGDYDVDGVCASTICYRGLDRAGAKVRPFIPHREKDGYGLSVKGIDELVSKYPETRLIITVDNGIVALDQAKYIKAKGIDLIITDHHLKKEDGGVPEAVSIVHSEALCGAGVAWCLMREVLKDGADDLVEFAAIGTVADQMSLVGVNRAIVKEGLRRINSSEFVGILALADVAGLKMGEISAYSLGHVIGPMINAVGRLDHAMPAVKLLCSDNKERAYEYARELIAANQERKFLMNEAVEEAMLQVREEDLVTVVWSDKWIPGIIGLIAARLVDRFNRPAMAISLMGEVAKGSARSIDGFNIVEFLRESEEQLTALGGHSGAAGFSLEIEKVNEFRESLIKKAKGRGLEGGEKRIKVDVEISVSKIDMDLIHLISEFEPFGAGNPRPVFLAKSVRVESLRLVGEGKHLKLILSGKEAIGFGLGDKFGGLREGVFCDAVFYPEVDSFNGREKIQMNIKDLKIG